jgi:epoxyqueuosine reductase
MSASALSMAEPLSTDAVRALALEAGFSLCGFARPEPIPPEHLLGWLEAGLDADMDWMRERARERLDVRNVFPAAKTVVALACNYHRDGSASERSPIARYARGRDYHYTLKDRIRRLRRLLEARHPDVDTYASVDTGPMMEKVWATRAGLGYVGKNGCLITEPFGSWVLLATLTLDREVDAYHEAPAVDRCGSCHLCVMSCPTHAILEGRRVDARLCLSYQTIENPNEVPLPIRPAFDTVFGCDICQTVCPLNRHPVPTADARFQPRAVVSLGTRELAALTPEQYDQLVPGTPLARAKYDGLRRNAAYALGATRDEGARPVLEKLCSDSSELVRSAAQWALQELSRRPSAANASRSGPPFLPRR